MPETRIKSGFFNVFIKKNFSIFYLAFFLAGQSSPRAGGSLPPWPLTRDVSLDPSLGRCPSPRPPGAFAMWQREAALKSHFPCRKMFGDVKVSRAALRRLASLVPWHLPVLDAITDQISVLCSLKGRDVPPFTHILIKNIKMLLKWYKFKILLCYNTFTATPILATGRRCAGMEILTSFFISVVASIIGYYVCKWLDGDT